MFIYLRNVALGLVLLSCSSVPKKADSASLEAVCSEIIDRAIDFRDPNREDKLAGCQAYVEFQAYKSQAARSLLNLNVLYSSFISKDLRSVAAIISGSDKIEDYDMKCSNFKEIILSAIPKMAKQIVTAETKLELMHPKVGVISEYLEQKRRLHRRVEEIRIGINDYECQ